MVILGQPPLLQQGLNLLRGEAVAVLHGRLAGDHVEQLIEDPQKNLRHLRIRREPEGCSSFTSARYRVLGSIERSKNPTVPLSTESRKR